MMITNIFPMARYDFLVVPKVIIVVIYWLLSAFVRTLVAQEDALVAGEYNMMAVVGLRALSSAILWCEMVRWRLKRRRILW